MWSSSGQRSHTLTVFKWFQVCYERPWRGTLNSLTSGTNVLLPQTVTAVTHAPSSTHLPGLSQHIHEDNSRPVSLVTSVNCWHTLVGGDYVTDSKLPWSAWRFSDVCSSRWCNKSIFKLWRWPSDWNMLTVLFASSSCRSVSNHVLVVFLWWIFFFFGLDFTVNVETIMSQWSQVSLIYTAHYHRWFIGVIGFYFLYNMSFSHNCILHQLFTCSDGINGSTVRLYMLLVSG